MRLRLASLVVVLGAAVAVSSSSDAHAQASDPGSGLALFTASYVYAAAMGTAVYRSQSGGPLWESLIPVAGPYIALKRLDSNSLLGGRLANGYSLENGRWWAGLYVSIFELAGWVLAPVWQGVGLATAAGGFVKAPRLVRAGRAAPTVTLGAMPFRSGGGVMVSATTW